MERIRVSCLLVLFCLASATLALDMELPLEDEPIWFYEKSTHACILANFHMDLQVTYRKIENNIPELIPSYEEMTMVTKKSYVVKGGTCGENSQTIILGWKKPNTNELRNIALEFNKTGDDDYRFSTIYTKYTLNNVTYKLGTTKIGLVTIPKDSSVKCFTGHTFDLQILGTENEPMDQSISYKFEEVKVHISNYRLQAFADATNEHFSDSIIECWFGLTFSYKIARIVTVVVFAVIILAILMCCCRRAKRYD